MARKLGIAARGSAKEASAWGNDVDKDMRSLRRVFKAFRVMSPEARRLFRAKINKPMGETSWQEAKKAKQRPRVASVLPSRQT